MTALLEVEAVCAGYGRAQVLHEVDLTIEEGSITAVLGANGAGKTTLLRSLSGLLKPWRGRVRYRGRDLLSTPVEDLVTIGVAHVPEGRGVIAELTVDENLRLGGLWRRGSTAKDETATAVRDVYALFEPLARRRNNPGHQLSGGERQMLALGRALVAKPSLLLLDEPSLGLAPPVTASILALLRHLRDETGLSVLLVEQNVHSALAIADEGVVVSLGRVVARGPAAQLKADEGLRHAYLGF
ncbi:MAG TPA: ABC transporter ATP-binding protein [Mycobacteriales bacterium]|nr:ABC transporter ATP-binding protein [Mycobacteriales bacterium]